PVQVGPLAPHLDVGFIQAPARIKATPPEPAQPLLHLRGVALDPAIDRRMVDRNAAFRQHFLKVAIADRIATIPAHRPQDHITLEMAPLEIRHRSVRPISAKHAQASRFLQQSHEEEQASLEASRLTVELFRAMNGDEADEAVGDEAPTTPEEEDERVMRTSVYLTRILFLLFGDDAGLWDTPHLFTTFVRNETTPESLGPQLNELFRVLNTPEDKRPKRLPGTL